jgi:CheY-like chemotaxis protein
MKTILVVDDDKMYLEFMSQWLSSNGYKVLTAENGQEGFSLCKQHKPDAVILDIMMPDMGGDEVADAIKDNPSISRIPIIFSTGMLTGQEVPKDHLVGGQYMIAKPFNGDELHEILQKVLLSTTE